MVWNEETIRHLRILWAEGHSTAEIGRRLGCGKNAAVGKAHRLGLTRRPNPARAGNSMPAECRSAIAADLWLGMSVGRCARKHGSGEKAIRDIRDAEGI